MRNAVAISDEIDDSSKLANYISHSTAYRIKSQDEIFGFLAKLIKQHTLLSVSIESPSLSYGSVILELNKDGGCFVLDELYPRNKITSSLRNEKLSIDIQLDSTQLSLNCVLDATSKKDGAEYYKAKMPSYIFCHQRREHYRVPVSIAKPLSADLSTENNVKMHSELRDISLERISARLTFQLSEGLNVGDEIPTCIIQIPDERNIICALEVVRIQETKPLRNIKIGAKFTELSNANRQDLSKALAKFGRENIKALKRQ